MITAMGQTDTDCVGRAMVTIPKTHDPETPLVEIRSLFEDDHVHMALIVDADRLLITTIERSDLDQIQSESRPVPQIGTLHGRTIGPAASIQDATSRLKAQQRRRLAVVDETGRLLGLLCLKRDGTGYCSDGGVLQRAAASRTSPGLTAR
jgi:CBS-domain-containing membrane protein